MSRLIDRVIAWTLILSGLFLCFMFLSGERIGLSMLFSAVACMGLNAAWKPVAARLKGRSRKTRLRYAAHLIDEWTLMDEDEALEKVRVLLQKHAAEQAYGGTIELVSLPRSSVLDAGRVLAAWRKHRGNSRITLVSLCPAGAQAEAYAAGLKEPSVTVIDARRLSSLLVREHKKVPDLFEPVKKRRLSFQTCGAMLRRVKPVRSALWAAGMMGFFWLTGRGVYLAASMLLLMALALRLILQGVSGPRTIR